jgi:hypothetical protein
MDNISHPWFVVEFHPTKYLLQLQNRHEGMRNVLSLAKRQLVSESNAWGGYLAFLRERDRVHGIPHSCSNCPIMNNNRVPFHFQRVIPKCVKQQVPAFKSQTTDPPILRNVYYAFGFEMKLEAIPNTGVFLTCEPFSPTSKQEQLQLPAGVVLDLGIIAPLLETDAKTPVQFFVKHFLFEGRPAEWSMIPSNHDLPLVFDLTDDRTGLLHDLAKENPLVFVRQTEELETPNVFVDSDPEGTIHIFLGHDRIEQEALSIPIGTPVELKVKRGVGKYTSYIDDNLTIEEISS